MKKRFAILLAFVLLLTTFAGGTAVFGETVPEDGQTEAAADSKTEEPAGDSKTEEPSGDSKTEEPAGDSKTEEPAGDSKTEETAEEKPGEEKSVPAGLSEKDRAVILETGTLTRHDKVEKDELTWEYDAENGTLTISGKGPMKDYSKGDPAPWEGQGSNVRKIIVEDGITTIGDYAFYDFWNNEHAVLPDSVEYIGEYAFYGQSILDGIPFPKNLKEIAEGAFREVKIHRAVEIPEGVEIIGRDAFRSNDFRDSVRIPASVCYLEEQAFANSLSLHHFIVSKENPCYIAVDGVLYNREQTVLLAYPPLKEKTEFAIPDTVTRIADWAFDLNLFVKKITIPASVTEVGEFAFRQLRVMEEYVADEKSSLFRTVDGVLYSRDGKILYDYPALKKDEVFVLPDEVETIGAGGFTLCSYLKDLVLSDNVQTIEWGAILYINGSVYLPESITKKEGIHPVNFYSEKAETGYDYSKEIRYIPPEERDDPKEEPTEIQVKPYEPTRLCYAGSQDRWDAFVEKTGLVLGDTQVETGVSVPEEVMKAWEDQEKEKKNRVTDVPAQAGDEGDLLGALYQEIDPEKGVHFSYEVHRDYMNTDQVYETHYKDGAFYSACTTIQNGYESTVVTFIENGKVYSLDPVSKTGAYVTTIPTGMLGAALLAMDPLYSALWIRSMDTNFTVQTREKDGVSYTVVSFPAGSLYSSGDFWFDKNGELAFYREGSEALLTTASMGDSFYTIRAIDEKVNEKLLSMSGYKIG